MRYYKWSLEERRKHSYFREENLCPALLNVALQSVRSGNYCAAFKTLDEAIELRKQYGWVDHFTGVTLYYIAILYMQIGNFRLALEVSQQAFDILEQCTPDHPVNIRTVNATAHCYLAMNDELNARRYFDIALAKYRSCKTIAITLKICMLHHCLVLGDPQQRQVAYSCLRKEFSEMSDTETNIGQRISEYMALYSAGTGKFWNWKVNGRELLSKHCKLCLNKYRVFSHCQSVVQMNNGVFCRGQSCKSSDSSCTRSQRQPSESSDSSITKSQRQPSESSDNSITESLREASESPYLHHTDPKKPV